MFSAVLKEVTGYFDRRVLLSTFFPSLVFLGGGLLVVLLLQLGGSELLSRWNGQSGSIQAILVAGFLVFIAFCTIVLANLQDTVERLYQGYWPSTRLSELVAGHLRARVDRRRDELMARDHALEHLAEVIRQEQTAFPTQQEIGAATESSLLPAQRAGVVVDTSIRQLRTRLGALGHVYASSADPGGLAQQVRSSWNATAAGVADLDQGAGEVDAAWDERLRQLTELTEQASETLRRLAEELSERRLMLHRDLFLRYPPASETVMPTALGNVLKAAERYPVKRYGLDAVVIWPRLQPLLPAEFATLLQQAKTSLDLILTLVTFTWLVGLPLSALVALRIPWPASAGALGVRITIFLLLSAAVVLVGRGLYHNAVAASLGYGEKLKAAFDLHRWRVLEELHLRTPPDLEEERVTWAELSGMLYRGTTPDSDYYQYRVEERTKPQVPARRRVCVPTRPLDAYCTVSSADFQAAEAPVDSLPSDAIQEAADVDGLRPLASLPAGDPVPRRIFVEASRLHEVVTLSVTVSTFGFPGAEARVADVVDLLVVRWSPSTGRQVAAVFNDVLVLADAVPSTTEGLVHLVVAVPRDRRDEFLSATVEATVVLSRRIVLS